MNTAAPPDLLRWVAENLSLPVLQESSQGALRVNAAAGQLLAARQPRNMLEAAAGLTGLPIDSPALERVVQQGRRGKAHTELLEVISQQSRLHWQAVTLPVAEGWQLWLLPAQLRHAAQIQARAALADATMNVCHEIGNALTAITGWAELGSKTPQLSKEAQTAFRQIETGVHAARTMTRAMLDASSPRALATTTIDATEILQQVVGLLQPSARRARVTLETTIDDGLIMRCSRADLWTAVWNVAKNGIEALSTAGGTLRLSAQEQSGSIVITINDDGPGMSPQVQQSLFSPYFTTKPDGTGLGLVLVQQAVDNMQGNIQVMSTPGHGSSFRLELPCAPQDVTATASGIRRSYVPLQAQILLVEDDPSLRELIVTALSLQGAHVTAVKTGQEALLLDEAFDLALLDLLLPDMRGDELLAKLRSAKMIEKAILMSGDAFPKEVTLKAYPQLWLRKPFELDTLVRAARQQLGLRETSEISLEARR